MLKVLFEVLHIPDS